MPLETVVMQIVTALIISGIGVTGAAIISIRTFGIKLGGLGDQIERRFDNMSERMESNTALLKRDIDGVGEDIDEIKARMDRADERHGGHEDRIRRLEIRAAERDAFEKAMNMANGIQAVLPSRTDSAQS